MTATDLRELLERTLGAAYSIERELRGGGMSRVFAAEERALGRKVVVKVLPPELSGAVSAERFKREIQLAAKLQHPHIVPLLSADEADGLLYYTMPLIDGESLQARLAREGELPVFDAVRVLRDVADALAHAHRHGVVHRDVKPANVILSGGHGLVTDFGVAKALGTAAGEPPAEPVTGTGVALGTPRYMAPEQCAADPHVDHRADVYALGVLAYELLTGEPPIGGRSLQQVLAAHATQQPVPVTHLRPSVPPALAALVMRCLEKHAADRPQSADEVSRGLEGLAAWPRPTPAPRPRRRVAAYLAASAALLAVAGYALVARQPSLPAAAARAPMKSVAVLPFANMSADRENDYFADGMAEELINALTKIEGLRVPARTSSFAFKGKNLSVRAMADSLRVGAVLEGSVRKAGNRIRVTAQLINAADGYHLWSDMYERELEDVFAVQDEIARAITGALRVKLATPQSTPLVGRPTDDLDAYTLYLRGRQSWNRRTAGDLQQAIQYYDSATARDPQFARAHAGLAEVYTWLPTFTNVPPQSTYPKAKAAVLRALALDSSLAEAHTALAGIRSVDWDWSGAETAFARALALNPGDANAHLRYAVHLTSIGRHDEAIAEAKRGYELDPLSAIMGTVLSTRFYYARKYDAAIEQQRSTLELHPDFAQGRWGLARALLQKRQHREAIREAERAVALDPRDAGYAATLIYVYAASGERDRALRHLLELKRRGAREYTSPYAVALAYTGLGERDAALASLDRAAETRDPALVHPLLSDPLLDPLRSDPRFARLLRRMKLGP